MIRDFEALSVGANLCRQYLTAQQCVRFYSHDDLCHGGSDFSSRLPTSEEHSPALTLLLSRLLPQLIWVCLPFSVDGCRSSRLRWEWVGPPSALVRGAWGFELGRVAAWLGGWFDLQG